MSTLPENRTTSNTAGEHAADHNELHRLHNLASVFRPSILANGTFGIYSRGAGPFAGNVFSADGWLAEQGGTSTIQVDQETSTTVGPWSVRSLKATYTQGSAVSRIYQSYGDFAQQRTYTVTFRAYVKTSVASGIRLGINDGVGRTYSSYHSGGGGWEQLIVSRVIDSAATVAHFEFWMSSTGTYYADSADAFHEDAAVSINVPFYETTPYTAWLEAAKQYVQLPVTWYGYAQQNNQQFIVPLTWHVKMNATPTLSLFTTGTPTNVYTGYPTFTATNNFAGYMTIVSDAAGPISLVGYVLEAVA